MDQSGDENAGPQVRKRRKRYCSKLSYSNKKAIKSKEYRSNETPERREARLSHMRLLAQLRRYSETKEEREQRLQALRWYQKARSKKRQPSLKEKIEPCIFENQVTNDETASKYITTLQRDEQSRAEKLSGRGLLKTSNSKERNADNGLKDYKTKKQVTFNLCNQGEYNSNLTGHPNSLKRKSKRDFITECDGNLFKGFNRKSENKANSKHITYKKNVDMWLNGRTSFKKSSKTQCERLNSILKSTPILSVNDFQDISKLNEAMRNSMDCEQETKPLSDLQNISTRLNFEQIPIVSVENCKFDGKKKSNITKSEVLNYKNDEGEHFKECHFWKVDLKNRENLTNILKYDEEMSVNMSNNDKLSLRPVMVQLKRRNYHLDLNNKSHIVSDESRSVSLPNNPYCLQTFDSTGKVSPPQSQLNSNKVSKHGKPRISVKPLSDLM